MSAIVETKNLTKYYGKARGIIDVSLSIEEGEIFGFIGPNGAGKSTTIRTLLSLIFKTSGEAKIFGLDTEAHKVEILREVGYLPSEVFYYDNMRAIDLFRYSASFYKKDCTARIGELAELLQVNLKQKIEDMSLGNKKKVGIIQGLLHSPRLIILDEPTSGLDPLMQKTFFELIRAENKRGATVLLSSHILGEVQRICDRVAIIKEGRIVSVQSMSEMRENAYKNVSLVFMEDGAAAGFALEGAQNLQVSDWSVSFLYKGGVNPLLAEISKYRLANVDIAEPSLEEIFLHYYTD
ncbi:MAG TPA: ABC transporter ATP-binding protein [Feifaniaceae bacterium]|nr:ABC transporter ATP-binding protein [Feifaniaceae bacterium]